MQQNKPANPDNPTNSTLIQCLIDAESVGGQPVEVVKAIQLLRKYYLTTGRADLSDIDDKFSRHRYPDKSITWARLTRYSDETAYIHELKPAAKSLLMLFLQMAAAGGKVSISKDMIKRLGIVKDRNAYSEGIKDLIASGAIVVYQKQRGHRPPVYMINPNLISAGTVPTDLLVKEFHELGGHDKYCFIHGSVQLATEKGITEHGEVYYYQTLVDRPPDNEKAASAPTADTAIQSKNASPQDAT